LKIFCLFPTLLPIGSEIESDSFDPEIVCQVDTDISEHLDAQIRTLPHSLMRLDEFARAAQVFGQAVSFSPHSVMADLSMLQVDHSSLAPQPDLLNQSDQKLSTLSPIIKKATRGNALPSKSVNSLSNDQSALSANFIGGIESDNKAINQSNINESPPISAEDLEGELQRIFNQRRGEHLYDRLSQKAKITKKIIGKKKRHQAVFYLGFGLAVAGLLVLLLCGFFQASYLLATQNWKREPRLIQLNTDES
jgi:hypothetical protein